MTTHFALSSLMTFILRLWGVDTSLTPERRELSDDLIFAAAQLANARSRRRFNSPENKCRDRMSEIGQQGETR